MTVASPFGIGCAFLGELLESGRRGEPGDPTWAALAGTIAGSWRRAVGGGVEALFGRRLAAEGLTEAQALAWLERGLARRAASTPPGFDLLRRLVPGDARVADVPRGIGRYAETVLAHSFSGPLFAPSVPAALARALEAHIGGLLEHAGVRPSDGAWEVFAQRPLLLRLVCGRTRQWVQGCQRLARRLRRDRLAVEGLVGARQRLQVQEVTLGLSDRHEGGETVARIRARDGKAFYYKPRSLAPERALGAFFRTCASVGLRLPPLPDAVARGSYGWVVEVRRADLASRAAVERWFFAAGSLAVAAWLLGLADLHWENVVAGEAGPVVVDGESWCRPRTVLDEGGKDDLLSSGLVSFPVNGPHGVREDGALLGGGRPEARSLPTFHGQPVDPRTYRHAVLAGARDAMEKILWAWRNGQLQLPLSQLARLRIRWVARPSETYAAFLRSVLENPRVRYCWQLSVLAEARWRPLLASGIPMNLLLPLLHAEARALEEFAIPRLTLPAARAGGIVTRSGKQQILERLGLLGEEFIQGQLAQLAGALPQPKGNGDGVLAGGAARVARALAEEGADGKVGPHLRQGWAGRALAWSAWARVSGDEGARRRARHCLQRLLDAVEEHAPDGFYGFGTGLGGVVYALFACSRWLEERSYGEVARHLTEEALGGRQLPEVWDVEAGLAGLLLGAAEVCTACPTLQAGLSRVAGRVVAGFQRGGANGTLGVPGFAHGVSGVATALARVSAVTANPVWSGYAVSLLEHEPRAGSWLGEAELSGGARLPVPVNGWCHGPAGALLARELVPSALRTPTLVVQQQQARARVVPLKLTLPLSLCCGTIGRSEISLIIGELAGDERHMDEAKRLAAVLLSSGLWQRELDPRGGLLEGLPGLLFHLSRLLAPFQVGSVLAARVEGGDPWK